MLASETLLKGADYIDEHGLAKNGFAHDGEKVCPVVAMVKGMGGGYPDKSIRAMNDAIGMTVIDWVTMKGVTKREVVRTMRRVARELQKEGK